MKLIYCMASVYNPGGMERVLLNKLRWFTAQGSYELLLVTTDQQGRPPFYAFPEQVRMVDLGINYSLDNDRPALQKIVSYFRKRRLHRTRLSALLISWSLSTPPSPPSSRASGTGARRCWNCI